MAASAPALLKRLEQQGFGSITPSQGLNIISSLLAGSSLSSLGSIAASSFVWKSLIKRLDTPFLQEFGSVFKNKAPPSSSQVPTSGESFNVEADTRTMAYKEAVQSDIVVDVESKVKAVITTVLGQEISQVQPLMEVCNFSSTLILFSL